MWLGVAVLPVLYLCVAVGLGVAVLLLCVAVLAVSQFCGCVVVWLGVAML